MTHNNLKGGLPSATLVLKNPKTSSLDEMKIHYDKYFFLLDGQEFQIRLFNPLKTKIAAKISLNGEISNSMIIIKPGQSITIDRFLDEKKKMVFETYKIDKNNKDSVNAIVDNGLLKIEFFNKSTLNTITYSYTSTPYYSYNGLINMNGNYTANGNINCSGSVSTYTSSVSNISDSINFNDIQFNSNEKSLKDTGRIERGKDSKQNFINTNEDFFYYPFHTINYELKPISDYSSFVETEIREYCTDCGYRIRKKSWQFCPKCGSKL